MQPAVMATPRARNPATANVDFSYELHLRSAGAALPDPGRAREHSNLGRPNATSEAILNAGSSAGIAHGQFNRRGSTVGQVC